MNQQDINPAAPAPAEAMPDAGGDRSVVSRVWDVFRREPMLLVTSSYVFVSVIGLWDSYWFYRRFDVQILEYLQSSDYFVAGLRRPAYLILLAWTLLTSVLALWPERWRRRHPGATARLDGRWWFRALIPRRGDWWAYFGLHPETMATLAAVVMMALVLFTHSGTRADRIREGGGQAVSVSVIDARGELAGDWRVLGTSSAFVFLWDVAAQRAELVPTDALAGIRPRPAPPADGDAGAAAAGGNGVE
ncbi:hypothetical protein FQY83_08215 [Luteimonas marina]|uniref:Uncharacterized protein n=1 Tax=Luteimonas marina TaxID=488485 RepID=A0A5C5U6C4_9GAMM|nr:hypothetical protein [Luteimonas marina]TWT21329.1 hypothetical protein FQY83_08215 [Luteimonas marina]